MSEEFSILGASCTSEGGVKREANRRERALSQNRGYMFTDGVHAGYEVMVVTKERDKDEVRTKGSWTEKLHHPGRTRTRVTALI